MKEKVEMAISDDRGNKEVEKEYQKGLEKAAITHLVVAILIATVTFTVGITMCGGFTGKDGTCSGSATLSSSAAFMSFVIFDNISMVFSSSAVLIHLLMPLLPKPELRANVLIVAWLFILLAMVTMMVAFVTSSYAVLVHSSDFVIA